MLYLHMLLPRHCFFHRLREIIRGIRHYHFSRIGKCLRELHLMIVHMLSEGSAARHDDGDLAGINGVHDRPGTGMHDQQVGVVYMLDEFLHAKKRRGQASPIAEGSMAMLDNNGLGKLRRQVVNPFEKAREWLQCVAQ